MYCKPLNVISFALLPILIELVQSSFNKFFEIFNTFEQFKSKYYKQCGIQIDEFSFKDNFFLNFSSNNVLVKNNTATKS